MKKTVCCMLLAVLLVFPFAALAEGTVWQEGTTETFTASGGISAEQALQGYIDRAFGLSSGIAPRAEPRGSLLKGKEAKVYEYLAKEIKKVASGERTSTEFEIPYTVYLDQTSYDAEELGVDNIVLDNAITDEAVNSISKKTEVDIGTVQKALLVDYPYDLYWYDKTAGWHTSSEGITAHYSGMWYLSLAGDHITVTLHVAKEYSATNEIGKTAMNPNLPAAIQTAAQNVKTIVQENKGNSDIEKLITYKMEICNRVEYNDPAAAGGIAYGNPWQLIWVFDDDPATTVVCEGYSKAFKYLCDLSEFQTKLTVSLMSGDMWVDDEEAGPHMWNLVAMGNGKNYLVDVTNCDGDAVGAPDLLFMTGYAYKSPDGDTYGYKGRKDCMVYYAYDSDTVLLYSNDELAASETAFDPSAYPAANLYGYTLTIPEDTVYIDSQAFADLGEPVNILIRRGDVTIAADAFSGSEVILIGPAELETWADQQGIPFVLISDLPE